MRVTESRKIATEVGRAVELTFITVLTIGFLGSSHCIGMCGGIVGALNSGLPESRRRSALMQFMHHFSYNFGRIISYMVAGTLVGLIGAQAEHLALARVLPIGGLIAGLFMVALGLYLAGWWRAVAGLENLGRHVWKYIQPLGKRFLPVQGPLHAFGLGLVWGWLPCGLVYSALALAMISASAERGAMMMLGFGLGTLPMLLVMGKASHHIAKIVRSPIMRQVAGVSVMLFGIYTGVTSLSGSHQHAASAQPVSQAMNDAQTAFSLMFGEACAAVGDAVGIDVN
ncbi:MAG: sulfite exporter TauE/SafE family protein [Magnetovibrio sp.]|nr:sulfite exporter TauE/SafE family protein [Magnetovibrio sp.]